jgi:hypothetical protein
MRACRTPTLCEKRKGWATHTEPRWGLLLEKKMAGPFADRPFD